MPYRLPVEGLMEATVVLDTDQVPPAGVLPSEIEKPTHTEVGPVIAVGSAFTVIEAVL